MKTNHQHELNASQASSRKTWGGEKIVLTTVEVVNDESVTVEASMDYKTAKSLMLSLRNSLIDAKVIRGKKKYS